jgi:cysteine desulfurase
VNRVYLDWNSSAPPLQCALQAMQTAAHSSWGNPSSAHFIGRRALQVVERARESVAELIGAKPREVVFTSGATEANNLALRSLCSDAAALITSRLEHPSVVRVAEAMQQSGLSVIWLQVDASGAVCVQSLKRALAEMSEPGRAVVAIQAANHETGVIQPVAEAIALASECGARVHVDAVQAVGKLDARAWRGADTLSVSSHKLGGPVAIGALAARSCSALKPMLLGGGQELGSRAGTQSAVLAAGFGAAADWAIHGPQRYASVQPLRDLLEASLTEFGGVVNAGPNRLPHVTNVSFPDLRGDELVIGLDLEGVCVASGSACASGAQELSPVIEAMAGPARALSAVRASLGESTSEQEIRFAISAWKTVLARAKPMDKALLEVDH